MAMAEQGSVAGALLLGRCTLDAAADGVGGSTDLYGRGGADNVAGQGGKGGLQCGYGGCALCRGQKGKRARVTRQGGGGGNRQPVGCTSSEGGW
jgi:hypothetical protein